MASAIISSTSVSTSATSTTATVARSDDGDLDREDPIGTASSGVGGGGGGENTDNIDNSVSVVVESQLETVHRKVDVFSFTDNDNNHSQHQREQEQERMQISQPLSEKNRSQKMIEVGNECTNISSLLSSSLGANNDPETPKRTVATNGKDFGEGPLPRELRRIIMEVAKTGKCSWLSWNHETTTVTAKRKGCEVETTASANSNCSLGNVQTSAAFSKSTSLMKVASSSSQYSPSFVNTGTSGGIVRKQSSFSGGTVVARRSTGIPPRKRHRNGVVHKGGERMRFSNPDGAFGRSNASSISRKRPLVCVRTNSGTSSGTTNSTSNSSNNNNNTNNNIISSAFKLNSNTPNATSFSSATLGGLYSSAPSSVGSGRSTGSEPEYDSAQYECDSEGTSATTNSEISVRKTTRSKRSGSANPHGTQINSGLDTWTDTATMGDGEDETNSVDGNNNIPGSPYKTLQTAFRGALGLVLDHFYQNRDNGYKLSPAENKRNERFAETLNRNSNNNSNSTDDCDLMMKGDKLSSLLSSEYVFQQRRQRLMAMLLPTISQAGNEKQNEEPPFTIQRIAEVLVAPDRYYTQTHKLCNCLEKLLLVFSSTDSFGGSTGGDTSQRRREEREFAALADEKGRQEFNLRQRRLANSKLPIDDFRTDDNIEPFSMSRSSSNNIPMPEESTTQNPSCKAKSGSLVVRSEKETMATNVHSMSLSQKRVITASSDSSTSREILEALSRDSLRTKFDYVGTEHNVPNIANERDIRVIAENRRMTNSPPLPGLNMAPGVASGPKISVPSHGDVNSYVRQHLSEQQQNEDHDLVARVTSPILFSPRNESNLETTATNMHMLQFHHAVALAGVSLNRPNNPSPLDNLMTIDASTISQMRCQTNTTGAGPGSESTDGRSSASNSDIDSESDDISFDDSASDRSDGSDSGSTSAHHEPFTVARAMALNRIQQQQRLQSRALISLGTSHQGEGLRFPADSEYQSSDSIDSMRAEDSGGSDSSSSDLAD